MRHWLALILMLSAPAQAGEWWQADQEHASGPPPSASATGEEAAPRVVVSIKPLHALVAGVMRGDDEVPYLLVSGKSALHGFQLRPSQVKAAQSAEVVFYIGQGLESFMPRLLASLPQSTKRIAMAGQNGMYLLPARAGNFAEAEEETPAEQMRRIASNYGGIGGANSAATSDSSARMNQMYGNLASQLGPNPPPPPPLALPGDGSTDARLREMYGSLASELGNHSESANGSAHSHTPPDPSAFATYGPPPSAYTEDGDAEEMEQGQPDAHLWLDPVNAITMVDVIAAVLSERYPQKAALYKRNAEDLKRDIAAADDEVRERLAPLRAKRFIVFHDGTQYFERAYGLRATDAVLSAPEVMAGARHVMALRERLRKNDIACIFREPQFDDRAVKQITQGSNVRIGTLDPEGAGLTEGPGMYPQLLLAMADAMEECLR